MAVTITTSPVYPTTKAPTRVRFALSGGGNFVRVWLTDAPLGSKYKTELTSTGQARIALFSGGAAEIWEFQPDRGGMYLLAIQEITRGASAFGGGYKGDPDGYPSETLIGESSVTARFGQRLEMPVGVKGDIATLGLWVWDSTIRATTEAVQGEMTPALFDPKSERAKAAVASTGVVTALAALVDTTSTTALGTLSTILNEMIDDFNAHRTQGGVHAANDTVNVIASSFRNANNEDALKRSVAELVKKLDQHMRNDNGSGTGTGAYHTNADMVNTLIAGPPGNMAGVISSLADVWRAYEAHRVQTGSVHASNDTTNTLTALPKLLDLHRNFLAHIQSAAPAAPPTANPLAVTLVSGAGMKESN